MPHSASTISFILINHNFARYLKPCLESCLNQALPGDEIIAVDSGSTDHSRQILCSFENDLKLIFQDNRGMGSALNAALPIASKKWIWIIDCDDFLLPGGVGKIRPLFDAHSVLIYGGFVRVNKRGDPLPDAAQVSLPFLHGDLGQTLCSWGVSPFPPTSGLVYRAETLRQIPSIPEKRFFRGVDEYYRRRLPFYGRVNCVPAPVFAYRIHSHSINQSTTRLAASVFLRQHYLAEKKAFHYLKLEASSRGIPTPSHRGCVDTPHAFLNLFLQKSRKNHISTAWKYLYRSLTGDLSMRACKKWAFLFLGVAVSALPSPLDRSLTAMVFRRRLQTLMRLSIKSTS